MNVSATAFLVFYVGLVACGAAMVAGKTRLYQIAFGVTAAALALGVGLEYGAAGLFSALGVVVIGIPVGIVLVARLVPALVWSEVRQLYPDEPKAAPMEPLTLAGAWKLMLGVTP